MRDRLRYHLPRAAAAAIAFGLLVASAALATSPGRDGRILFQPFNAGAGEGNPDSGIFDIRPSGTAQRKLHLPRDADHPVYSPDGRHLVYDYGASPTSLYVARADGTHARRVTPRSVDVDTEQAAWSPAGTKIAVGFASAAGALTNRIGVIPATGGTPKVIARDGISPAWSVHGRIAYVVGASIWAMDADGGQRRRLTHPPADTADDHPNWAPDGRHLLFDRQSNHDPDNPTAVILDTDASGGHLKQLSPAGMFAQEPVWAPDGRQIVFSGAMTSAVWLKQGGQLWVMRADGAAAHQITHLRATATNPSWQPVR